VLKIGTSGDSKKRGNYMEQLNLSCKKLVWTKWIRHVVFMQEHKFNEHSSYNIEPTK
jgi:hypothetical protein